MILSNSKSLSTPFNFLKEHYGHYKLSFFQLQNNQLRFVFENDTLCVIADIATDSVILDSHINFNSPQINWRFIEISTYSDTNSYEIIESWVSKDYKWS